MLDDSFPLWKQLPKSIRSLPLSSFKKSRSRASGGAQATCLLHIWIKIGQYFTYQIKNTNVQFKLSSFPSEYSYNTRMYEYMVENVSILLYFVPTSNAKDINFFEISPKLLTLISA